jgi:hypothetical protein
VNDDGFDDVIIGARGADPNGESSGAAYVVYGFETRVSITGGGRTVTVTEADGDIVTLKLSQGGLLPQDIVLAADGSIAILDLTNLAPPAGLGAHFKPLNINIGVKTPSGMPGDGLTKVGFINADGVALGKLKLQGELGRLVAGLGGGGMAAKSISILGNFGNLAGAGALSQFFGALGKLTVKGIPFKWMAT